MLNKKSINGIAKIKIKTKYILETILNGYFSQSRLINTLNYKKVKKLYPRKNSKKVMDDMLKINREDGITIICNLHSLQIAKKYCDRLIGLSEGEVVFDGKPDQLTTDIAKKLYDLDDE